MLVCQACGRCQQAHHERTGQDSARLGPQKARGRRSDNQQCEQPSGPQQQRHEAEQLEGAADGLEGPQPHDQELEQVLTIGEVAERRWRLGKDRLDRVAQTPALGWHVRRLQPRRLGRPRQWGQPDQDETLQQHENRQSGRQLERAGPELRVVKEEQQPETAEAGAQTEDEREKPDRRRRGVGRGWCGWPLVGVGLPDAGEHHTKDEDVQVGERVELERHNRKVSRGVQSPGVVASVPLGVPARYHGGEDHGEEAERSQKEEQADGGGERRQPQDHAPREHVERQPERDEARQEPAVHLRRGEREGFGGAWCGSCSHRCHTPAAAEQGAGSGERGWRPDPRQLAAHLDGALWKPRDETLRQHSLRHQMVEFGQCLAFPPPLGEAEKERDGKRRVDHGRALLHKGQHGLRRFGRER
eukprot:scaffold15486_cov111-Isochrysis_galbana.AAC.14